MEHKRLHFLLLAFSISLMVSAQSMTYNVDDMVRNQFLKAEIGSGTLGAGGFFADQYYKLLHSDYRNMANNPANNKLASRALSYAEVLKQENYALQIKDSLEKRAEIEVLNIADRQVDVEWVVEKEKIERQQAIFKKNIQDIIYYGGSQDDKDAWTHIYNLVDESKENAHKAYMPNSQRKAVYLLLYKDLCMYNTTLNQSKARWWAARQVRDNEGHSARFVRNRGMLSDCYGRWKLAWGGKRYGGGGAHGGATGIDIGHGN